MGCNLGSNGSWQGVWQEARQEGQHPTIHRTNPAAAWPDGGDFLRSRDRVFQIRPVFGGLVACRRLLAGNWIRWEA